MVGGDREGEGQEKEQRDVAARAPRRHPVRRAPEPRHVVAARSGWQYATRSERLI